MGARGTRNGGTGLWEWEHGALGMGARGERGVREAWGGTAGCRRDPGKTAQAARAGKQGAAEG